MELKNNTGMVCFLCAGPIIWSPDTSGQTWSNIQTFEKLLNLLRFYCSFYYFLSLVPPSQNVSQHLRRPKGWSWWGDGGVKLWASVARLAANHFYEHAGGQKKAPRFFFLLNSIVEMSKAHPELTSSR